ncbi:hypothetical protein PEL8287_02545 [Roseovarius litorisediminis]|uniref:Hedgehog/Intein (Hint) domain-containing protein n=1 Tax=Roseovarius litorisediminis TaxID=1312363 RepID=A0A1Y5SZW6_9RHOB|nr:Hint domain-containing protein [Roseovarius litorisediminis]SLN48887.1 hypothetical protein PEL8287_02545 [Roseovarius litorisediminis]
MGFVSDTVVDGKLDRRYLTGICGDANLRTPLGPRRVEMLNPGDMVVTRDHGLQPVRMIWTRTVSASDMQKHPDLAPIRLKPRAIGPMMPSRDLRIASGHRALIPGYLIANVPDDTSYLMRVDAVALASDAAYMDRAADTVVFYNLVFDRHEVFCAEGVPIESFRPSPKAISLLDVDARETIVDLFPNLARKRCAYPSAKHPVARGRSYRACHA